MSATSFRKLLSTKRTTVHQTIVEETENFTPAVTTIPSEEQDMPKPSGPSTSQDYPQDHEFYFPAASSSKDSELDPQRKLLSTKRTTVHQTIVEETESSTPAVTTIPSEEQDMPKPSCPSTSQAYTQDHEFYFPAASTSKDSELDPQTKRLSTKRKVRNQTVVEETENVTPPEKKIKKRRIGLIERDELNNPGTARPEFCHRIDLPETVEPEHKKMWSHSCNFSKNLKRVRFYLKKGGKGTWKILYTFPMMKKYDMRNVTKTRYMLNSDNYPADRNAHFLDIDPRNCYCPCD